MIDSIFKWIMAIIIVLLSPIIYTNVQSYLTVYVFDLINILSINSKILIAIVFVIFNIFGATVTAFSTALPCSYLLINYQKAISIVLIFSILCVPCYTAIIQTHTRVFVVSIFLAQCLSVSVIVFLFAKLGSHIAQGKKKERGQILDVDEG